MFYHSQIYETFTIPNTINEISSHSFESSNITTINFPTSLTTIGDHAFDNSSLNGIITISSSVTYLGSYSFASTNIKEFHCPHLHILREFTLYSCQELHTIELSPEMLTLKY